MTDSNSLLSAGTIAPDFTLPSGIQETLTLSSLRGNPVVLAFYPADWSGVCGDQLVLYNQVLPMFQEFKATLLGISVDGPFSHQAFREARHLNFTLLADFEPKGQVAKQYGAYAAKQGLCERALFVLDKEGVIAWSYLSPMGENPGADGILDALEKLSA